MNKFLPKSRRLTTSIALALATLSVASAGHAAGLGRLNVQSALGQPLRAEVEVTSLTKEESQSLSAKLASPDAFKQAGLEYSSALNGLRFAVDRRADGKAFVRISSNQPVNEPFVDLLVELNWASGKFVREYTFLLDPPELKIGQQNQDNQVVAPALAAAGTGAVADTAAPVVPPSVARPAPAARQATRTAQASAAPAVQSTAPGGSVAVRNGETLASIANRVKPAEISLDQAIVAIYRANPTAFFGSVHQLRTGAELRIPDGAAMGAVDAQSARAEIRAQMANFNRYKARLAANARTVEAGRAGQSASGQISGSVTDPGAADSATDQVKLSRSAAAAGGRSVASSAAENRVAVDAATREAQSRVNELEKNVADLRRLLEMKDKQLAELQSAAKAATAPAAARGAVTPPAQPAANAGAEAAAQQAAAAAAAAVAQRESAAKEAAAKEAAAAEAAAKDVAAKEAAAKEAVAAAQREAQAQAGTAQQPVTPPVTAEAPVAPVAPAQPAEPVAAAAEAPAEPAAEGGLLDDLTENPLVLPGIAAIIALIAGTAWVAVRRRRNVEKFEDSLIAPDGFAANSLFGSTGGQTGVDTHNSLFTASRETTSEVHSTEVDPIAEAEVYIAYGREAQAEEILKEALRKQPERQAIRLKLLEIYAGRKDARAFGDLASEMYEATGGQNEEWPKVVTLGLSIDPDNSLYTGKADGQGSHSVAGAFTEAAETFTGDFAESQTPSGFRRDDDAPRSGGAAAGAAIAGLSAAAAASLASRGHTETHAQETAHFESTGTEFGSSVAAQPAVAEHDTPSLEFDLDLDTELKRAHAPDSDLARAVNGKYDLPSLDLPTTTGTAVDTGFAASAVAELGEDLKIDLPSVEEADARPARADAAPATQSGTTAMDLSAIGLDLQPSTMVPPPNADVARWQEMATKLDLASAYEEIGDSEGARELLQEVLKGGDAEQQQRAQMMLGKLG